MVDGSVLSLLAAAGFVGALGVAIKYFGMVRLIAGYDSDRVTDEQGLADFVGTNTLYVAALLVLVAVLEYTEPFGDTGLVWIGFLLAVFGLTARMIRGGLGTRPRHESSRRVRIRDHTLSLESALPFGTRGERDYS